MNEKDFLQTRCTTTHLTYEVIGEICPGGMTRKDCPLRQKLSELQEKYHIGYSELENGNLLVPLWALLKKDADYDNTGRGESFDLKTTKQDICLKCYVANRDKEKTEPEPKTEKPSIQTVIFGYQLSGTNCPKGMTSGKCPLRKELADIEERYNIGYKTLGDKTLLVPRTYYDARTNAFFDMAKRSREICSRCFEQNRQNVKG